MHEITEARIARLEEAEIIPFGPDAYYQPLHADEENPLPIRTGIQTSQPGYVAPMHSHPYLEVLLILEGHAEAWFEGQEDQKIQLNAGDSIALPPHQRHSFRVLGDREMKLLGTHLSPKRIVDYTDRKTDAKGYPLLDAITPESV